jgi:hypothetical protein
MIGMKKPILSKLSNEVKNYFVKLNKQCSLQEHDRP